MKLPCLTPPECALNAAIHGARALPASGAAFRSGLSPQDCGTFKAIGCAASVAACAAVCIGSVGTACLECFAALGMGGCVDCL